MPFETSAPEAALKDAEIALARSPSAVEPLFARARALDRLGRNGPASDAYLAVLRVDATHLDALSGLGALAIKTGHRNAAKTAFAQASAAHPHRADPHAKLALLLAEEGDEAGAREHFETALRLEPDNNLAHRGMAVLLLKVGRTEAAQRHGRAGFRGQADCWPYRGTGQPLSLLLVSSAVGPNVPIERFLDDRVFEKWTLTPEFFDPNADLPRHDVVFLGIGDADGCGEALDAAAAILTRTRARVLNPPHRVRQTGRAVNAKRLEPIPGVSTARTVEWSREALLAADASEALAKAGFAWPLLLRSPGFHGGEYFEQVGRPEDLPGVVARLPGETILVIQFVDTRGVDGKFRKYRVMMIDGRLYPLHLAVSPQWKVHYFSADMADRPEHRAEDEAFLQDMPRVIGPRAMQALERIRDLLALDYGGIDFALGGRGTVVVFEANATMTIVPPADDERWRYRAAAVECVERAVRRMLVRAAGRLDESAEAPIGMAPRAKLMRP
jgi:tetratricopeptide (TPR) repeat protein